VLPAVLPSGTDSGCRLTEKLLHHKQMKGLGMRPKHQDRQSQAERNRDLLPSCPAMHLWHRLRKGDCHGARAPNGGVNRVPPRHVVTSS
jgi:hypothetical protein